MRSSRIRKEWLENPTMWELKRCSGRPAYCLDTRAETRRGPLIPQGCPVRLQQSRAQNVA